VGIACADMELTAAFVLGSFTVASDSGTVYDPEQEATVRIFNEGTPLALELVSGVAVEKLVGRGTSYYHLCYETPDISATIAEAVNSGAICVRGPRPAVLFAGRLVAFVFTPIGLIEFLETQ
jgi:methylmalonyl-CoA/ethylmalonyl-CoA epimerase